MNPFNFYKYLPFLLRKRFTEKYIIIESDDWGLERALFKETIEWMKLKFGENKFSRWSTDSLETSKDLNDLFDLIDSFKNKFEYSPVITANFITHNIDYSNVVNLNFIPISKGFNIQSEDVRHLYKTGIENGYIFPQLHGYSHYNLSELKKYFYTDEGKETFEKKFFVARSTIRGNFSFLHGELSESNTEAYRINDAAKEFKNFFGFASKTIIPPTFIFDSKLFKVLKKNNIDLIQSSNRMTTSSKKKHNMPFFKKRNGFIWSIRNARLDPHPEYNYDHEQCLNTIKSAFNNKIPAVIDFHRVNFAGKYTPQYKEKSLSELKALFNKIYLKFPDAKFIHSQKLNDMIWQQEIK